MLSLVAAQLITGNARAAAVIIIVQVNKTNKKTGFDFNFFKGREGETSSSVEQATCYPLP